MAFSGEMHNCSSWSLRWLTQNKSGFQHLTVVDRHLQTTSNRSAHTAAWPTCFIMSLQYQVPVPHLLRFHPASPLWVKWGAWSSWKTLWTPAWTTCLATGFSPSLKPPDVSVLQDPPPPSRSCRSMLLQLAKWKRCPKTAWSGQSIGDKDVAESYRKKKKKEKRLFLSDSARPSLKDMPTSSSSAIRCHRQSYWGSYLCVRVWVNVSVTTQSPFLSIRHYSFKSHLRIVQGLWNWTGPIIWRNVFCFFCFLSGTY